jgi:CRISPR-associated exonuclease Cas4
VMDDQRVPPPLSGETAVQRCKGCSLRDRCQPQAGAAALRRVAQGLFDPDLDLGPEG